MKVPEIGSEEMDLMKQLAWLAFTWASCFLCEKPLDPILAHTVQGKFVCTTCNGGRERIFILRKEV